MHRRQFLLSALSLGIVAPRSRAAATGEAGESGVFARPEAAGATPASQDVFYHRPAAWRSDGPVVMVLHGVNRNASTYRDHWIAQAGRFGFLLLCPLFSPAKFPGAAWYGQGGMDRATSAQLRAFAVPDRVFADADRRFGATAKRFHLYGHSAGAQFVQRMQLLMPSAHVDRAIAANAGFYTFPTFDAPYPYGLRGVDIPDRQAADFLRSPLIVLLGEADTDPAHPALVRNAMADAQGTHRFQRGMSFVEAGRREAARRGVELGWHVETVPGVGHSNRLMAPAAAARLFA